jgi:hypothetical protein
LGTFILDLVGYNPKHDRIAIISDQKSKSLTQSLFQVNKNLNIGLEIKRLIIQKYFLGDHEQFQKKGFPTCRISENYLPFPEKHYPGNPFYHTSQDSLGRLNLTQIYKTTQLIAGTLLELARFSNKEHF